MNRCCVVTLAESGKSADEAKSVCKGPSLSVRWTVRKKKKKKICRHSY